MEATLWLGSQLTLDVLKNYEAKYQHDLGASARSRYDYDDERPELDPTYLVSSDRIGLTVMEKVRGTNVIKVHGSLTPTFSRWHAWFPGMVTSYEAIRDALAILQEAGETRVVMDFATGGGAVRGLDNVTAAMARAQENGLRIDGHTDSAAFSAGYWIMSACQTLTASRMAEVGSIGTLMVLGTYANTEENMGITFTVLKEGEFKAIGNPYEALSDKDKAYLQKNLRETNQFFLDHVAGKRNLSLSDTDRWAEGQTFYANKAKNLGLIDRIITLDDLLASGASAKTTGDKRSFEMQISAEKLAQIEAGAAPESVLTAEELKHYNDTIAAEAATAEEAAAAAANAEAEAAAATPKDDNDPATAPVASAGDTDALHKALKENGKLEAKVEDLQAQIEKLQADLTAAKAESSSLLVVAQAAVEKLQNATKSPKEVKATATEVIGQYNDLLAKMATMFKPGQQSTSAPVADNTQEQQANYRHKAQQHTKR